MTIKPWGNRIIVRRLSAEEKVGDLFIPDMAQDKPMIAQVTAVGDGQRNEDGSLTPIDLEVGTHVLIGRYCGTEVELERGKDPIVIMSPDEILGVVTMLEVVA